MTKNNHNEINKQVAEQYKLLVNRATTFAVIVAGMLLLLKVIVWWITGSVSILAAMTDSLLDVFASVTNILVLRFALRPADDNHTFGHSKAEELAALVQGAFITGSALFLLLHGVQRLYNPQVIYQTELGIIVSVISIVLTGVLVLYQQKVLKVVNSPIVQADILNYKTDILMNIAILIAMGLSLYGIVYADALFAIAIALYIMINAIKVAWQAIQMLLDQALPEEEINKIKDIAEHHPDVLSIHDIKTRQAGAVRFIQLHMELDDHLSLVKAHEITDSLEKKLLRAFPLSEVILHQEPTSVVEVEMQQMKEQKK
ncbi:MULTISPECIES: cation diffusion facilitator family transporter [Pasteurellaceae]|uniref:Cation-efflux pump FieF n=1 Tax=Pasteurella atlantica TaxID=2827233 RepID=A0AAW8CFL2_9PAST|nr:cation diffusion facilitator family transporter [Pasteurella atlantica]MBR0573723.1 cation diffusion facilitator family transporter [Pasteurella atlantica]MDP8039642.1 cation diffusion facilitator family transporter [Pasteurella atlantica]MDP8041733.1 cation diffusion facilitator family transporter [Pasteurella atlantica]MDP8043993.1 cation diffusion facilitator family transporter [Pasteurella atlantica]MDP8045971.1 cation diffusion facilitator family transporter [Pasteurella atlantica]